MGPQEYEASHVLFWPLLPVFPSCWDGWYLRSFVFHSILQVSRPAIAPILGGPPARKAQGPQGTLACGCTTGTSYALPPTHNPGPQQTNEKGPTRKKERRLEILNTMEIESWTCWFQSPSCILLKKQPKTKIMLRAEPSATNSIFPYHWPVTGFAHTMPFLP